MSRLLATLRGSLIALNLFVLFVRIISAQTIGTNQPGGVEKQENCPALKPYTELDKFGKFYLPEAVYEEARTQTNYECRHIWYLSDDIPVSGYIFKPEATNDRMWPVILYNRGGTGDFSLVDDLVRVEFYLLAKEGYVVLATEYRSIGDKGRRDEWGGADVHDVLNLTTVAKSVGYIDMERLFMLGVSRGGMMTYLALKNKVSVKAAAVIAGPSDLEPPGAVRPDFLNGDDGYDGWAKVWPDFEHRKEEHFRTRSAVTWADQINTPVLILHSRADTKVPVSQAFAIGEKLQQYKKEYELVIYGKDGHSLPLNRADRNQHIIRWFHAHDPAVVPTAAGNTSDRTIHAD
jgi:dipeptidyl aminopeptidase/acylaminoacyl peptidase